MNQNKTKKEALIKFYLQGRLEEIKKAISSDEESEKYHNKLLGISKKIVYQIELNNRDAYEYFILEIGEDVNGKKEIQNIEYHYTSLLWDDFVILVGDDFRAVAELFSWLIE